MLLASIVALYLTICALFTIPWELMFMTDMMVMMSSGCCMHDNFIAHVGYMHCIISGLSFRGGGAITQGRSR